jgi:hypothetical protein
VFGVGHGSDMLTSLNNALQRALNTWGLLDGGIKAEPEQRAHMLDRLRNPVKVEFLRRHLVRERLA